MPEAKSPTTLNLIGAGRVGQTLAHLWHAHKTLQVQDVLTTSLESAQKACDFIEAGRAVASAQEMRGADMWMIAVPDAQIGAAVQTLNVLQTQRPIVFHCSGAQGSDVLAPLAALGWRTASAHCILSFASSSSAVAQFSGTPCALEGDAEATETLQDAFTAIGARCFAVDGAQKLLYHAAAVFATNFLPVLQQVAEDAWHATGVPEDIVLQLRSQLLHNAVANITRLGPQGALTGPAARGDVAAIARQAQVVKEWDEQTGAAYESLSALALRMAERKTRST